MISLYLYIYIYIYIYIYMYMYICIYIYIHIYLSALASPTRRVLFGSLSLLRLHYCYCYCYCACYCYCYSQCYCLWRRPPRYLLGRGACLQPHWASPSAPGRGSRGPCGLPRARQPDPLAPPCRFVGGAPYVRVGVRRDRERC